MRTFNQTIRSIRPGYVYVVFFLIALTIAGSNALAILNVEDLPVFAPKEGYVFNAKLGLSGSEGNSDTAVFTATGKLTWEKGPNTVLLALEERYSEASNVAFVDETVAQLRYQRHIKSLISGETYFQIERNDIVLLKRRIIGNLGLRMSSPKNHPSFSGHLGLGAMYFDEIHDASDKVDDDQEDDGFRFGTYLSVTTKLNEQVTAHNTIYYQPLMNDIRDYQLLNHLVISTKMTDSMSFNAGMEVKHDSDYPKSLNLKDTDITYFTSISIQWR